MVVFPKIELFVAALWAVSPDGANKLVLLFAGCSVLAPALRPENGPPPLEAGVAEDWPKSDMVEDTAGGLSAGGYGYRIVCSCLGDRVQNFQARRLRFSGLAEWPLFTDNRSRYIKTAGKVLATH